jgi:hypothetical protein
LPAKDIDKHLQGGDYTNGNAMQKIQLLLKEKYSLVHVPAERKVKQWHALVTQLLREGQTKEHAGMIAAKKVFPYEYREYRIYAGADMDTILALF